MPRTCDPSTIEENTRRAMAAGVPYAPVSMLITESSSTKISFRALDRNRVPTEYRDIPWNKDMWIECPSTLSATADRPPPVGEAGVLYLAKELVEGLGLLGTPKWPTALFMVVQAAHLPLWPTSVVVSGYQLYDGSLSFGSVDLLNPKHALTVQNTDPKAGDPPQQLALDGGAVTLSLTHAGFSDCFGLTPPIESLRRAVATIQERTDPHEIARAWHVVATWRDMSAQRAELRTEEARRLLSQVLKRVEL